MISRASINTKMHFQPWLLQLALCFSVLLGSGFNLQLQAAPYTVVQTELVDATRAKTSVFAARKFQLNSSKTFLTSWPYAIQLFDQSALLHLHRLIAAQLKTYRQKSWLFSFPDVKISLKIPAPSSSDKLPQLTVS